MQIFLSQQCESLTGSLGRSFGYAIRRQKNGFYGMRNSKGYVPRDGHWRFILACANLAKMHLHVVDINLSWQELSTALYEARQFSAAASVSANEKKVGKTTYNAQDVINLQTTFGL